MLIVKKILLKDYYLDLGIQERVVQKEERQAQERVVQKQEQERE